jgi:hypothetical protein
MPDRKWNGKLYRPVKFGEGMQPVHRTPDGFELGLESAGRFEVFTMAKFPNAKGAKQNAAEAGMRSRMA